MSGITLDEARHQWFNDTIRDGGRCPCCTRFHKLYRRGINKTMAASLVWLACMTEDGDWVHLPSKAPRWLLRSNQLSTMRWWSLCERRAPLPDEDAKHSGFWRVTLLGLRWAKNEDGVVIPKYAATYDGELYRPDSFEGPMVRVSDCVSRFSYREVMDVSYDPKHDPKEDPKEDDDDE